MTASAEEQTMLRDSVRAWADRESPVTAFRRLRDSGETGVVDVSAWRSISALGWTGIAIPETYGGGGLGFAAAGMVVTELGRTLVAAPLTANLIATAAILGGNALQKSRWLPAIARGECIAAFACDEGPHHDPSRIATQARRATGGWHLTGVKPFVAEGGAADLFVVAADAGLFVVPSHLEGVTRAERTMADCRNYVDLSLDVTLPEDALLTGSDLEATLACMRAMTAAEMLGLAEAAFAMTLDYLKNRIQFGRPIGSFQALQHRAAILFTRLALMRSAVEGGLAALDCDGESVTLPVSLAKAQAGDTLNLVLREAVQMHGGIGMTDEHDVGFYLKRGKILEMIGGTASFHRDRYATLRGY